MPRCDVALAPEGKAQQISSYALVPLQSRGLPRRLRASPDPGRRSRRQCHFFFGQDSRHPAPNQRRSPFLHRRDHIGRSIGQFYLFVVMAQFACGHAHPRTLKRQDTVVPVSRPHFGATPFRHTWGKSVSGSGSSRSPRKPPREVSWDRSSGGSDRTHLWRGGTGSGRRRNPSSIS